MSDFSFSERGVFWILDQSGQYDENAGSAGLLTIDKNGTINCELDIDDIGWQDLPKNSLDVGNLTPKIVGFLKNTGKYVRLEQTYVKSTAITRRGRYVPEIFTAFICLVSEELVLYSENDRYISEILFELGDISPWLDYESPKVTHIDSRLTISYPEDMTTEYITGQGKLSVSCQTLYGADIEKRKVNVVQRGAILFRPTEKMTLSDIRNFISYFEDMMIVFCDQPLRINWPKIKIEDSSKNSDVFVARVTQQDHNFLVLDCWILYSDIRTDFGDIFDKWMNNRSKYNTAYYLFVGTKYKTELHLEHIFINLIWGLESLHKQTTQPFTKMSLKERLKQLFLTNPSSFEEKALDEFCQKCANRRNEISHYGGPEPGSNQKEFFKDLDQISHALDILYHVAILQSIGISNTEIERVLFRRRAAGSIRFYLQQVGLFPKHVA